MLLSRPVDTLLRILLLLTAIGLFAGSLLTYDTSRQWDPMARVLVFGVMLAGALVAGIVGGDVLRRQRTFRITPKRWGAAVDGDPPPRRLPAAGGPALPIRLGGNVEFWAVVGAITATIALLSARAARNAFAGEGPDAFSEDAPVLALFAVLAGLLTLRAIVGLLAAPGAMTIAADHLRLGAALGYWPPLRIERSEVRGIAGNGGLVVATADRAFSSSNILFAAKHPADELAAAWPEFGPDVEETVVQATFAGRVGELPPDARRVATRVLRRRRVRNLVVFLVGFAALAALAGWYLAQRAANDRLLREGRVVEARVVDTKDGNMLFPGLAEVEFTLGDESVTGVLAAGPFDEFRSELVGKLLPILVDPADPALVRLPEERNIRPQLWSLGTGALITAILGFALFSTANRSLRILDESPFRPGRIRTTRPKGRQRHVEVQATLEEDGGLAETGWLPAGQASGARGLDESERDAWVGHWKNGSIFIVEDPPRVITAPGMGSREGS